MINISFRKIVLKIASYLLFIIFIPSIVCAQVYKSINPSEFSPGTIIKNGVNLRFQVANDSFRVMGGTNGIANLNYTTPNDNSNTIQFIDKNFVYHNGISWIKLNYVQATPSQTSNLPANPLSGTVIYNNNRYFGYDGTTWYLIDTLPQSVFSPSIVPGVTFWLDASDPSTITLNNNKVVLWKDKIGNRNAYQYFDNCRPIYSQDENGKLVDFGNYVQNSSYGGKFLYLNSGGPQQTVFVVLGSAGGGGKSVLGSSGGFFDRPGTTASDPIFSPNAGVYNDGARVASYNAPNPVLSAYLNGTSINPQITGLSGNTDLFCFSTRKTNSAFDLLGASAGNQFGGMTVREIICFTSEITDDTRQKIEGYLAWKWRLTNKLPSTHAYKNQAPGNQPNLQTPYNDLKRYKNGLFVHLVGRHYHPNTTMGTFSTNQLVCENFDINAFINQIVATKLDYIVFTAWHGVFDLYYNSATHLRWRGDGASYTATNIDLIGKIAYGLKIKGIATYLYVHPTAGSFINYGPDRGNIGIDHPVPKQRYNDYMNELLQESVEKFGNTIDGFFIDEGFSDYGTHDVLDLHRLKLTIKKNNPNLQILQNFGAPYLTTELGADETTPGGFPNESMPAYSYILPMPFLASMWTPSGPLATSSVKYSTTSMYRYVLLQSSSNMEGGGILWAASPYLGTGAPFENGVIDNLTSLGNKIAPIKESIQNTYPSTSYPTSGGTTIGLSGWGVANKSADNLYEYLHILNPPSGTTLDIDLPADGKLFESAVLLPQNTPLQLSTTATGYRIINNAGWNTENTVIKLSVNQVATQPIPTSFPYLLNNINIGNGAAYSIRKIKSTYNGPCMKVRRDSDGQLLDIGFDPNELLDTVALKQFIGTNSGFVQVWYDQSGNAYNASQFSTNDQPAIISQGTIEKINSKPAIKFNYKRLVAPNNFGLVNMLCTVAKMSSTSYLPGLIGAQNSDWGLRFFDGYSSFAQGFQYSDYGNGAVVINGTIRSRFNEQYILLNTPYSIIALRGDGAGSFNQGVGIGGYFHNGERAWNGFISEVIVSPEPKNIRISNKIYSNQQIFFNF